MLIHEAVSSSGIDALDAELLLSEVLHTDRTWLFAHPDDVLDDAHLQSYRTYVARRRGGEPVAYIVGRQDFFGRTFSVDSSVLIPRPATEGLVELALHALNGGDVPEQSTIDTHIVAWHRKKESWRPVRLVADIGTGSGCIAVTLACERPDLRIIATDSSETAVRTARNNAGKHHVADRIDFRIGSCLTSIADIHEPYVLISNPPYIPDGTPLDDTVIRFEPHDALFAGPEGTDVLREIIQSAAADPWCKGWMIECREEQTHRTIPTAASIESFCKRSPYCDE